MILELFKLSEECIAEMRHNEEMMMSFKDNSDFKEAEHCYICQGKFDKCKQFSKVRDRDHRTGKYRGAAHSCCNINYFSNRYLPVVFHNLRGYDGHLIIKEAYDLSFSTMIKACAVYRDCSKLSQPFQKKNKEYFTPEFSAQKLRAVIESKSITDNGKVFAWDNKVIPS